MAQPHMRATSSALRPRGLRFASRSQCTSSRSRTTASGIGEPGPRVDAVELGSDDEGVHRRGALAPAGGTAEQPRPSARSNPAERPFSVPIR